MNRRLMSLTCALLWPSLLKCSAHAVSGAANDPNFQIRFYEKKLDKHPRLFAGFAQLGAAYLEKARETHDVTWLKKARHALERSLDIQPNLNAYAAMAGLSNFSHHFERALDFAERTANAHPGDPRVLVLKVEANLGLGRLREVAELLDATSIRNSKNDVTLPVIRGRWLAEQERYDEARNAFADAAAQARAAGAFDMAIWAETNAAGMMLDSKQPEHAIAHLKAASNMPAGKRSIQSVLRIHWAEYHELRGEPEQALREYEALLGEQQDPELFRRAFVLARTLGQADRAKEFFTACEQAAERIADAGEIFALETQARLYADAKVKLDRAEQLTLQSFEYKRDRSARETLAYVRSQRKIAE